MFDSIQTKFQKKEGGHYLNISYNYSQKEIISMALIMEESLRD